MTFAQQVASEIAASRDQVREAIAGLDDEQMSAPAIDGWSVRDHLAHLTIWHEFRFFEISRVARGGKATFQEIPDEEIDAFNEMMGRHRRGLSVQQAISDLEFAWALVLDTVQNVDDDALNGRHYLEIGPQGGAGHDAEHAEMILAWRQKEGI
jgi:uncharacterized damage-inducible protein DinB